MGFDHLYPYQFVGAKFLAERRYAYLADDMGLGKTIQGVAACDLVGATNVLVICPAVARCNWVRECEAHQKITRPVAEVQGPKSTIPSGGVVVISYDFAKKFQERVVGRRWAVIILDEAQYLKTPSSARTRAILGPNTDGLFGLVGSASRVWALSGTPIPNNASELWSILNVFCKDRLPRGGFFGFCRRYCEGYTGDYGFVVTGLKNGNELRKIMRPFFIRRKKAGVLPELPPIRFETVTLESACDAKKILADVEVPDGLIAALDKGTLPKDLPGDVATLRRLTGLLKVLPAINLLAHEMATGLSKVVVFAYHRDVITELMNGLKAFGPVTVHGGVSRKNRQDAIDRFQTDPSCRVFVGQLTAAGTAITLTAASDVLLVECSWVPADNLQAAMRVHRIGQENSVLVRFVALAKSLDERITAVVRRKTADIASILD